jgi:fatty-acyl-CoA synthase
MTGTFKYSKTALVREGYDPNASADALFFDSADAPAFVPLDLPMYRRIQDREIRL